MPILQADLDFVRERIGIARNHRESHLLNIKIILELFPEILVALAEKRIGTLHILIPAVDTIGEMETSVLRFNLPFHKMTVLLQHRLHVIVTKIGMGKLFITLAKLESEVTILQKSAQHNVANIKIENMLKSLKIDPIVTAIAIIKHPSERCSRSFLTDFDVITRPIQIGGKGLHQDIVNETGHIGVRIGESRVFRLSQVGFLHIT